MSSKELPIGPQIGAEVLHHLAKAFSPADRATGLSGERFRIDTRRRTDIDAVLFTHAYADHCHRNGRS